MTTYRVTFEDGRIGPCHDHLASTVRADYLGDLAAAIRCIAHPYLSGRVEVVIDQREEEDQPVGFIYCGHITVSRFDVEEIASPSLVTRPRPPTDPETGGTACL